MVDNDFWWTFKWDQIIKTSSWLTINLLLIYRICFIYSQIIPDILEDEKLLMF